ncbi:MULTISPECIES: proline dehydrogenase family protein [Brevibacillus]|uniref:proline dehydrogenase family protein n=1 Tax=Brevibacillus TaxID=55080 RepID=UPI000EE5032F|nr:MULTISPECIES: proline dehydrogenase family protein [Brevibacillus]MED2255354.1 proline dehydrogenase family protein [Brevibacillus parabrevis]HBZ79116.1 proline dehydrogenase [Brevibacillus sp.]
MNNQEKQTAHVLKTIARDESIKQFVQSTPQLYKLLLSAAKRYVTGETREEAMHIAARLKQWGYQTSIEYIGENTLDEAAAQLAKREFLQVAKDCSRLDTAANISFDLSHLGLLIQPKTALEHVKEMAECAKAHGQYLMISMEESEKTEAILQIYERLTERHANVGITLQAHLHRSVDDLKRLLHLPGKIRLVKGAFQEPQQLALPRSPELNERYLQLAERCVEAGHDCALATHDQAIVAALCERGYLQRPNVELELLYGVRPELARELRKKGLPVRVYLTYGTEWYLYLCHRLAEHPAHVHQAIADMFDPTRIRDSEYDTTRVEA